MPSSIVSEIPSLAPKESLPKKDLPEEALEEEIKIDDDWLDLYPVTKDAVLNPESMTTYPLEELRAFFGEQTYLYYQLGIAEEDPIDKAARGIRNTNVNFPIENIRYVEQTEEQEDKDGETIDVVKRYYYTLYKVAEGGFFRVSWMVFKNAGLIYHGGGIYTKSELTREDFKNVKVGTTLYDIMKIDPYLDIGSIQTTMPISESVSLLQNGELIYIYCLFNWDALESDEEVVYPEEVKTPLDQERYWLIVEEISLLDVKDAPWFELGKMLPQDMELCFGA
ncbi:MAG: hypothetical protein ACOX3W_03620 [Christensenellaceae bacterium]